MGADSGIKSGAVVPWADPRAELDDIKAEGLRGQQTVDGAVARLSAFTKDEGKWGHRGLGYATVAGFLQAECPWLAELAIPVSPRREIVALLAAEKATQKAIASALGVDQATVSRDFMHLHNPRSDSETVTPRNAPARSANASRQARHRERGKAGAAHDPDCQCGACQSARPGAYRPPVPGAAGTAEPGVTSATVKPPVVLDPDPRPCQRCAHLEQRIAELKAAHPDTILRAELEAVTADRDRLAALLAARRSEAPVAAEQAAPAAVPQPEPQAPDDELEPAAADPDPDERRPCGSVHASKVVIVADGSRQRIKSPSGEELEWLCAEHRALLADRAGAEVIPAPGGEDFLSFDAGTCQWPAPAAVTA